jgi:hypothetical protein
MSAESGAAMPQHSAERLCLSGERSLIDSRLRLEHAAAQPQIKKNKEHR